MANTLEELLTKAILDKHINEFEYKQFTNSEGFGTVYSYDWKGNDNEIKVVLKRFKVDKDINKEIIHEFIYKLKLLQKTYNPNIIEFYGFTKDYQGHYNMILQFASDGNLQEYLKKNFVKLQWIDKLNIAKEIVNGLLFLHDNSIIHRNLHSKNVLIHRGQIKITDFSLTKQIDEVSLSSDSNIHGMLAYIDPECLFVPKHERNKKSDIYSLGVILWEISSGRPPYESSESNLLYFQAIQGIMEEPIEGTPLKYVELYKQCWDQIPSLRPETKLVHEILSHLIESVQNLDLVEIASFDDSSSLNKYENDIKSRKKASSLDWDLSCKNIGPNKKINKLVEILCKDTTITSLELRSNQLGSEGGKALAEVLCKNVNLTHLNLEGNELGLGVKALAEALCKNTTLTFLDLSVNKFCSEEGKALANALLNNTSLTSLNLSNNYLNIEGGKAFADTLCKNTTLTYLDLYSNELGSEGGKALAEALCKNSTLTSLDIGYNDIGLQGVKELANALCKNTTLTFLNLESNELDSEGGKVLAEILCNNSTLTSLDLSHNQLGLEGGKAIAEALCKNTSLTYLNLYNNQLGPVVGIMLANALCKNTSLTKLCFGDNQFCSEGGKAFAEVLCKNTTLTSLDLSKNQFSSEGGKALAEALCKNNTLISLDLENNQFGSEGGKVFAEVLCKNTTLTTLDISENQFDSEVGKAIAKTLCKNTTLTSLYLTNDQFDSEIKTMLKNACNKNIKLYC